MKFQPDQFGSAITSYGPGWIAIGGQRLEHSVVLHSTGEHALWACAGFDELTDAHFTPLAELRPELVLFGSGAALRFPGAGEMIVSLERHHCTFGNAEKRAWA